MVGISVVIAVVKSKPLILKVWLGGLDSIEEQIRNPTKNGKN